VYQYLQAKGVIVRPLKGYALEEHLRISVGTEEQNNRVLSILAQYQK
jgi:histidinol-phosphate aminotransferase